MMLEQMELERLIERDRSISDKDRSELQEIINLGSFVERKTLDCRGKIIPSNIRYLTVTRLRINNQQLTRLPESINNLVFLTKLDLSHNQLERFPESIFNFPMLTYLNLSYNQLTSLPESIGKFQKIKKFNSIRNQVMNLWRSIGNVLKIPKIGVADFRYDNFLHSYSPLPAPRSLLSRLVFHTSIQQRLAKIILVCNRITNLSENTCDLVNLSVLNLSFNQLTILPENIGNLRNLLELNLRSNQLSTLPESIYNLRRLQVLDISHNPIVSLSKKISNFSVLCSFYIDGDRLIDISVLKNLWSGFRVNYLGVEFNIRQHKRYLTEASNWKSKWLLSERNAEVRRVLVEQLGYEKICKDLNALNLDTWREYTLLKIDGFRAVYSSDYRRMHREPMVLLKMTCPSTQHIHIVRVPPEMVSAEAAITWVNHGIHPDEFAVQT